MIDLELTIEFEIDHCDENYTDVYAITRDCNGKIESRVLMPEKFVENFNDKIQNRIIEYYEG